MRKATKTVAGCLGIAAGLAGLEHGYFEVLQGNTHPVGQVFPSMGPPCEPTVAWNACEPAMSILPNLQATGILALLLGQFLVGYFFNDTLKSVIGFGLLLILAMLPLSVYDAYARDAVQYAETLP
jgi:hypothetical protein